MPPPAPNETLVSVVVATRNRRDALVRCLDALAAQTLTDFEFIVVDDASTDDTPEVLSAFARRHPDRRIRCLRNDPQAGANPSRNRGVRESTGRFVAFIDDDAVAEPQWLERLTAGFTASEVAAVTGLVRSVPARNLFELTFKGTKRVHARNGIHATRLGGANMCVRRALLLEHGLDEDRAPVDADTSVSGRGDEEGLFLRLRAAGSTQRLAPDAVVLHDHPLTGRAFFRQAFRGGRAAARLVHKYHLPPRLDLLFFALGYVTLPLGLLDRRLLVVPACLLALALVAITYNDLCRKKKTVVETLITFPLLLAYYHVRLAGYLWQSVRLVLRIDRIERVRLP